MSEFHVVVVEIGAIEKHSNADSLSVTQVMGGYPVIFRNGEFKEGDRAVYISVDGLVPLEDDRWAFLRNPAKPKTHERIKAKKLRGVFSMGILTKADPSWEVGQNVQEALGILKWEPEVDKFSTGGDNVSCPIDVPVYDIEGLRKYKHLLKEDEEVFISEKIHGANARMAVDSEGNLFVGSRTQFKKEDPNNLWWKVANKYSLKEKLSKYPNMVFYGEVFGQVQDLKYDAQKGELFFRVFDIFDLKTRKYLDVDECLRIVAESGLESVPVLYRGPWSEKLMELAEGKSTIANNIREGFVVRPVKERYDNNVGRVILKMVGQNYLLR